MMRVGTGLDVHAFTEGVPLWLGGVLIDHPRGLAGHSDGDAAVHAVIDALLGAAGRGDIGQWFPSTEERWRGVRSTAMLTEVGEALGRDGWSIENVDLTIVATEPRLAPHREAMRGAIAAALQCDVTRVSVKATTTEGLGFTGRREGIAAQAIATVKLP